MSLLLHAVVLLVGKGVKTHTGPDCISASTTNTSFTDHFWNPGGSSWFSVADYQTPSIEGNKAGSVHPVIKTKKRAAQPDWLATFLINSTYTAWLFMPEFVLPDCIEKKSAQISFGSIQYLHSLSSTTVRWFCSNNTLTAAHSSPSCPCIQRRWSHNDSYTHTWANLVSDTDNEFYQPWLFRPFLWVQALFEQREHIVGGTLCNIKA